MGGKHEHRVDERPSARLLHESEQFVDFRKRQEQAIPEFGLLGFGQATSLDLPFNFGPRLEWRLLRQLWQSKSLFREFAFDPSLIDGPIPYTTQRDDFLLDGACANPSSPYGLLGGTSVGVPLKITDA